MEPLGVILGAAAFGLAANFKKPLRKAAVFTASQVMAAGERLRTAVHEIKEEVEDIVAEAQYENVKRKNADSGMSETGQTSDIDVDKEEIEKQ